MDTISSLITRIEIETRQNLAISTPPSPELNSCIARQQPPVTANTPGGDIPPPCFINSINQLRCFSTALSSFLSRYDELQSHITFINSSIEYKLSGQLVDTASPNLSALTHLSETSCNQIVTACPEVVLSERISKESESDEQRSHETARANESTVFSLDFDGIGTSKKPEVVDASENSEEIEVYKKDLEIELEEVDVLKNPEEEVALSEKAVEIEASERPEEIDVSMKLEEIDLPRNPKEIDVLKKHAESDTWKKPEETVAEASCAQTIITVPVAIVSEQHPDGITNCEQSHENMGTPECLEEIDKLKKPEVIETSKNTEEIDILKNAEQTDICKNSVDIDTRMNPVEINTSENLEENGILKKAGETDVSMKPTETEYSKNWIVSVLEFLCQRMYAKRVRKHVTRHWFEMNKLHKQIAKALKMAKDPAKLVLENIGSFFLQGCKSFCKDYQINLARLASILILECFVMISSDGLKIAKTEKTSAEQAATRWRNRMIREGGLGQTDELDARGLLLFISGFGIQDNVFKIRDIVALIRASNMKEISTALRCSAFLIPKIPEVINFMVKNNLEIEAADIAYTFGLEDACHPENILRTRLHDLVKDIQNGSFQTLDAMEQHLCDLKSVKECLESHDVDPSILLPDFKINETIENLERETNEWRLTQKSKSLENAIHPESMQKPLGFAETDSSKKPEETVAETSRALAIIVFSEQTHSRMTINCKETPEKAKVVDISEKPEEANICKNAEETEIENSKKSIISELESLCKDMSIKKLKRHVTAHYSEMKKLHKEIAKALKLAKDPAKLVLRTIGRFFIQSSRIFCKNSPLTEIRLALVLILECFVMISSDGIEIANTEKKHAAEIAAYWWDRMIKEGGAGHMDELDAQGVLLFISGFGVQNDVFKIQDIMDLIRASNVKEISTALRSSVFLISKIPEVIDLMVKNNLEIEAAEIAYTFGLEDKCHPQTILRTYLQNLVKDIPNDSSCQTLEAMKQQLLDLKSVKERLESHNIDPSVLLPEFKINEMIENLVREVNVESLTILKRKSSENPTDQKAKRPRFNHKNMPRHHNHVVDHHGMIPYNQSTQPSTHYFGQNHPNSYISGPAEGFPGSYDQMVHRADVPVPPYGWHGPTGQTYDSQPHGRQWEWGPLESYRQFQDVPVLCGGFPRRRAPPEPFHGFQDVPPHGDFRRRRNPSTDLYSFADKV